MQHFNSDGIKIAYLDEGEGDPVLLIHGFASNVRTNWIGPGWVTMLKQAGRRVIALDNRGHGGSDKPYDPDYYDAALMAEDARRLLDHLEIEKADVMGYSMGARITAFLSINHPDRVRSAVFGGLGINMVRGTSYSDETARALEADSLDDVTNERARMFRRFAEQTGNDLKALAAVMRGPRRKIGEEDIRSIKVPVLVAAGSKDDIAGSPEELAALIPGAKALVIPDRDHMLAVGDKVFRFGVIDFLEERP